MTRRISEYTPEPVKCTVGTVQESWVTLLEDEA